MADLPHTGQPEWESEQVSPWLTQNNLSRTFDAFCTRGTVQRRESTPPADCNDGDCFLIDAGASGDWAGEDGGVAIASGADASNGWIIVPAASIEREGNSLYLVEDRLTLKWQGGLWREGAELFIDTRYAPDGGVVRWDQSNGEFYVAAE